MVDSSSRVGYVGTRYPLQETTKQEKLSGRKVAEGERTVFRRAPATKQTFLLKFLGKREARGKPRNHLPCALLLDLWIEQNTGRKVGLGGLEYN